MRKFTYRLLATLLVALLITHGLLHGFLIPSAYDILLTSLNVLLVVYAADALANAVRRREAERLLEEADEEEEGEDCTNPHTLSDRRDAFDSTDPARLDDLAHSPDSLTRTFVAINRHTPLPTLHSLSTDEHPGVRQAVEERLKRMSETPYKDVKTNDKRTEPAHPYIVGYIHLHKRNGRIHHSSIYVYKREGCPFVNSAKTRSRIVNLEDVENGHYTVLGDSTDGSGSLYLAPVPAGLKLGYGRKK